MKQLPEKWAIKTDDPKFYEWLNSVKYDTDVKSGVHLSNSYIHYEPSSFQKWSGNYKLNPGYEEITIEQWREAVYGHDLTVNGKLKRDGEIISQNGNAPTPKDFGGDKVEFKSNATEDSSTGELIGYEAPFDMPTWSLKKGEIFLVEHKAFREGGQSYFYSGCRYPAELVETWKPVYKAKEKKQEKVSTAYALEFYDKSNGRYQHETQGNTSVPRLFVDEENALKFIEQYGKEGRIYFPKKVYYKGGALLCYVESE